MRTQEEKQLAINTLETQKKSLSPFSMFGDPNQQTIEAQIKVINEGMDEEGIVELWGEGFGYTDKIRWDEGIDHGANGGSGASAVLYQGAYQIEKPSLNDDWIFKIPQAEINANPNISPSDQN